MKKQIYHLALAVFAVLMMNTATAQDTQQTVKTGTFTAIGKQITVAYSLPTNGGEATFTLTNNTGAALNSGESFTVQLPQVDGYAYDIAAYTNNVTPAPAYSLVLPESYGIGGTYTFSCKLVSMPAPAVGAAPTGTACSIIFRKK